MTAKYAIGTEFKTSNKVSCHCKVIDILKTYNNAGELVKIRYVASHTFMGQTVIDRDVLEITIAKGKLLMEKER